MPFLGVEHEEKKSKVFSSSFGEEVFPLDGLLRDINSRNHAIISSRCGQKSDLYSPPFMVSSERHDRQSYKQTERQLNARGTYRILRILSVIKARSVNFILFVSMQFEVVVLVLICYCFSPDGKFCVCCVVVVFMSSVSVLCMFVVFPVDGGIASLLSDFLKSFPGITEIMALAALIR